MFDAGYTDKFSSTPSKKKAEEQSKGFEKREIEEYNKRMKIANLFKTEDGQSILKAWKEKYCDSPAFHPEHIRIGGADYAHAYAYGVEALRSFVQSIEYAIDFIEKNPRFDVYWKNLGRTKDE